MEREAVECARWPHLFWLPELCFSFERLTDPRLARRRRGGLGTLEEPLFGHRVPARNDPYEEDDDDEDAAMHSARCRLRSQIEGPAVGLFH